ncbi:hypothetical protein ACFSTC_52945 [Nonomuraea ferruginea]
MDAWLHPGVERGHRAPCLDEPLRELDLEPRDRLRHGRHPGHDVAGQQTQGERVRVVQNDRVVRRQAE